MIEKKYNYWKIIAILFFLFGVVLFFYNSNENKNLSNEINDCRNKKTMCTEALNQSLIAWSNCIYSLGDVYGLNESDIDYFFINGEFPAYLNLTGGKI